MKHIVCFSGGKDSTALVLWAKENLHEFTTVFCDTGWEHPITYAYVEEINQTLLGGKLVRLKSEKYSGGFVQLCVERHAIPAVKSRFCTGELKVFPLHSYYKSLDDEITSYQGIRADESKSRSSMTDTEWVDDAGGYWIKRPLLRWNVEQVFDMHRKHGIKPNPLYLTGSSRVGCWPCIMTGLREMKRILSFYPEIRARLIDLERVVNESDDRGARRWPATFFASGTIPARFCSISGPTEECDCGHKQHPGDICNAKIDGAHSDICGCTCNQARIAYVPAAEDVFRYIESVDEDQLPLLPARSCMSVYNLCE